jgi:hypothetical protein
MSSAAPGLKMCARSGYSEEKKQRRGVGGLTSLCFGRAQDRETIKTCLRRSRQCWSKTYIPKMQIAPPAPTGQQVHTSAVKAQARYSFP